MARTPTTNKPLSIPDDVDDDKEYELATAAGLRAAAAQIDLGENPRRFVAVRGLHCPVCGGRRRVNITVQFCTGPRYPHLSPGNETALMELVCRDCHTPAWALLHQGPSGEDVAIMWPTAAGLRTPSTPDAVAYYLDQAARCESVSARSAAVSMYRAALEQLLFEQGYTGGMLGGKIKALENDIAANKAKKWALDLHPDFLTVIKDLGNGSIHPNGGDIRKQDALDAELLVHLRATMEELLDLVYEEPGRRAERLAKLKGAAAAVK
jgi:hypothetical protein